VARARAEVPYLSAVERIEFALDVSEDAVEARILRALHGLSGEGLMGLLMLAPDAPLAPGLMLLQVGVQPLGLGRGERGPVAHLR
jgi:hypothetical protein